MTGNPGFSYEEAFERNLGWFTDYEQQTLRNKKVAIAGMGGVGGAHLLTLARLGVGNFAIADLDEFEPANFNRQVGAMMSTIGQPKVEVLEHMAKDINPEMKIASFPKGVQNENIDQFLDGADLFVDGFDFFALDMRRKTFARCRELGIPAVTAAPIGMGVAFLAFTKASMSFEDYFQLEGRSELRQYINFFIGLAPKAMHRSYLVDPSRLDIAQRKTPSTIVGTQLCASFVGAQTAKLLLGRGDIKPAPYHYHFDAYLTKFRAGMRSGNGSFLQKLKGNAFERAFRRNIGVGRVEKLHSIASH